MTARACIDDFLSGHRLALVGLSTNARDVSRAVCRELAKRGYELVPVRPGVEEIDGRKAYGRVQDVPGHLDGAVVMTPAAASAGVVRDCDAAHVPRVWLFRGTGAGAVSDEAVTLCRERGIEVVAGECPLMFLGGGVHRLHGLARKVLGRYPKHARHCPPPSSPDGLAIALVLIELVVAVGALGGGIGLVADPSGASLGLPAPKNLPGLGFGSYLVPGILLLLANAALPIAVVVATLGGRGLARHGHAIAGAVLTGSMLVQLLMIGFVHPLQPVALLMGFVLLSLGSIHRARNGHRRDASRGGAA